MEKRREEKGSEGEERGNDLRFNDHLLLNNLAIGKGGSLVLNIPW